MKLLQHCQPSKHTHTHTHTHTNNDVCDFYYYRGLE